MKQKHANLIKERIGRFINIILFIMLIALTFSLARSVLKTRGTASQIGRAEETVRKLEETNTELKKELELVESEEYAEKQLRDKLGLSREGEIVVVLPDDELLRRLAPEPEEEEETLPDPNWKRWLKLFL